MTVGTTALAGPLPGLLLGPGSDGENLLLIIPPAPNTATMTRLIMLRFFLFNANSNVIQVRCGCKVGDEAFDFSVRLLVAPGARKVAPRCYPKQRLDTCFPGERELTALDLSHDYGVGRR